MRVNLLVMLGHKQAQFFGQYHASYTLTSPAPSDSINLRGVKGDMIPDHERQLLGAPGPVDSWQGELSQSDLL